MLTFRVYIYVPSVESLRRDPELWFTIDGGTGVVKGDKKEFLRVAHGYGLISTVEKNFIESNLDVIDDIVVTDNEEYR